MSHEEKELGQNQRSDQAPDSLIASLKQEIPGRINSAAGGFSIDDANRICRKLFEHDPKIFVPPLYLDNKLGPKENLQAAMVLFKKNPTWECMIVPYEVNGTHCGMVVVKKVDGQQSDQQQLQIFHCDPEGLPMRADSYVAAALGIQKPTEENNKHEHQQEIGHSLCVMKSITYAMEVTAHPEYAALQSQSDEEKLLYVLLALHAAQQEEKQLMSELQLFSRLVAINPRINAATIKSTITAQIEAEMNLAALDKHAEIQRIYATLTSSQAGDAPFIDSLCASFQITTEADKAVIQQMLRRLIATSLDQVDQKQNTIDRREKELGESLAKTYAEIQTEINQAMIAFTFPENENKADSDEEEASQTNKRLIRDALSGFNIVRKYLVQKNITGIPDDASVFHQICVGILSISAQDSEQKQHAQQEGLELFFGPPIEKEEQLLSKLLAVLKFVPEPENQCLIVCRLAGRYPNLNIRQKLGFDPNRIDQEGNAPLHMAIKKKNVDVVRALLDAKADPNLPDGNGNTPLCLAVYAGDLDVARALLDGNANPNQTNRQGETPLTLLITKVSPLIRYGILDQVSAPVQLLCRYGANIDATNNLGRTLLMRAAENGQREVVEFLLDKGAKTNVTDKMGYTPLMHAASKGHKEVVRSLLAAKAEIETKDTVTACTALMHAAMHGHKEVVSMLLSRRADIHARDAMKRTPLMHAAMHGRKEVVSLLLSRGAEIEAQDDEKMTPLMYAAMGGRTEVVSLLLENHANIEAQNDVGCTTLMRAVIANQIEMVELLLSKGAEINTRDNQGWTALFYAADNGHTKMVELLLRSGTKIKVDDRGQTPLSYAPANGDAKMIELLEAFSQTPPAGEEKQAPSEATRQEIAEATLSASNSPAASNDERVELQSDSDTVAIEERTPESKKEEVATLPTSEAAVPPTSTTACASRFLGAAPPADGNANPAGDNVNPARNDAEPTKETPQGPETPH